MLKSPIVLILILFISFSGLAIENGLKTFHCKISGFDAEYFLTMCKPGSKQHLNTPKKWVFTHDKKIKVNDQVSFSLNEEQISDWMKINKKYFSKK